MKLSRLALSLFGFYFAAFGTCFGVYFALQSGPWPSIAACAVLSACGFVLLHQAGRE